MMGCMINQKQTDLLSHYLIGQDGRYLSLEMQFDIFIRRGGEDIYLYICIFLY